MMICFNENEELPIKKISSHAFTGIIVSHYTLAIRLFKDITALHYSIPYDLSMITLKDGYSSYENGVPISTFTIPHMQFSQYITKTLLQIVEKKADNSAFNFTAELDNSLSIDIPYHLRLKRIISLGSINIDNYMNLKNYLIPEKQSLLPLRSSTRVGNASMRQLELPGSDTP